MNNDDLSEVNRIRADKRKANDKTMTNPKRKSIRNNNSVDLHMPHKKAESVSSQKKYYDKNKEEIKRKRRERYYKTHVHKKIGWTKPGSDEEKKERIRKSKRLYARRNKEKLTNNTRKWRAKRSQK